MRALVAWHGGLFLTEGKILVLSVSSLFLTRVGVYVCVSVCIRTQTHTAQMGCSDVSPGVGMRHLEGPSARPKGKDTCPTLLPTGLDSWKPGASYQAEETTPTRPDAPR